MSQKTFEYVIKLKDETTISTKLRKPLYNIQRQLDGDSVFIFFGNIIFVRKSEIISIQVIVKENKNEIN